MDTQYFPTVLQSIFHYAKTHGARNSFIYKGIIISYKELAEGILAGYQSLKNLGIKPEDKIVLAASNDISFVYAYFATHLARAVAVPVDPGVPKNKLLYIIDKISAKQVFMANHSHGFDVIDVFNQNVSTSGSRLSQEVSFPDDSTIADILFTTGTTGEPKGVMLTHSNILNAALNINNFIGNDLNDVEVLPLPLSHSFGLGRLRCNMLAGSAIVLVNGFSSAKRIFKAIEDWTATGFCFVPAGWNILNKLSGDFIGEYKDQLKYIEIGSSPMPSKTKMKLMELLPHTRICMHYGLTEASRAAFMEFHSDSQHLESIGQASPNVDIKIFDETGSLIPNGIEGEICIRGKMVTKQYWKNLSLTQDSFYGEYFKTGDLGKIDASGHIYLLGRKKEIINVGGRKVTPVEIEREILKINEIEDAACISIEDPLNITGEAIKAFIVARQKESISFNEITNILKESLEIYQVPTIYEWIDEIPKTSSGKIQRLELKKQEKKSLRV